MSSLISLRQGEETRRKLIQQQIKDKIPFPQPDQSIESIELNNLQEAPEIFIRKRQTFSINKIKSPAIVSPNKHSKFQFKNKVYAIDVDQISANDINFAEEAGEYDEKFPNKQNPWKKNGFIILMFIKKFTTILKSLNSYMKLKQFNKRIFQIFGDISSSYPYFRDRKYFINDQPTQVQIMLSVLRQSIIYKNMRIIYNLANFSYNPVQYVFQQIHVFIPESWFRMIWDIIIMILIIFNIFYIPIHICYHDDGSVAHFAFNTIPNWLLLTDIIVQLNTAYYHKGVLVVERKHILKNYIQKQFFIDLVTLIPFFYSFQGNFVIFQVVQELRSLRMIQIANTQVELLNLQDKQLAIYDLLKLLFMIIFIAHIFGCGLLFLSQTEGKFNVDDTWLSNKNLIQLELFDQYVAAFYWSVITMITVGYGDFIPINTQERLFIIIMTLISCGVFAYSINSIGEIISNITKKNQVFKKNMAMLVRHMRKQEMSYELQIRVKKYFEYLNEEKLEENETVQHLLNQLSGQLKRDVLLDIYGKIIKKKKIFKLNFSDKLLSELSLHMKEKRFIPDEEIYQENELLDKIYFITKGTVNLMLKLQTNQNPYRVIRKKQKGDCLGQYAFFSDQPSIYTAKSSTIVNVAYLMKEDFLRIIRNSPTDYQRFCLLKDNCNLYKTTRGLGIQCPTCDSFSHQIKECPLINYKCNKDKIIFQNSIQGEEQQRQNYNRNKVRLESSLQNCEAVRDSLIQYIMDNQEDLKIDDVMLRIDVIQESTRKYDKYTTKDMEESLILDQVVQFNSEKQGQHQDSDKRNKSQTIIQFEEQKIISERRIQNIQKTRRATKKLSIKPTINQLFDQSKSDFIINDKDIIQPPQQNPVIRNNSDKESMSQSQLPITSPQFRQNIDQSIGDTIQHSPQIRRQNTEKDIDSQHSRFSRHSTFKKQSSSTNSFQNNVGMSALTFEEYQNDNYNQNTCIDSLKLDILWQWDVYYPHNNIDNILIQLNKLYSKSKVNIEKIIKFRQQFMSKYHNRKKKISKQLQTINQ